MKREREKVIFDQGPIFTVLPEELLGTFEKNSVTPNVSNVRTWKCANTLPIVIANFIAGSDGQRLHILGDGITTVAHNVKIKTNTGANKILLTEKVYCFTYIDNVWIEDA